MKDKKIIICDIDGTIANLQHRLHYIRNPEGTKDWDSFHNTCLDDKPYRDVIQILWDLYDAGRRRGKEGSERDVYFFSGRNESVRSETIRWLWKHVLSPSMCHLVEITKEEYDELDNSGMGHTVRADMQLPTSKTRFFQLQPNLEMRSEGDRRDDVIVKYEMIYDYKFTPDDVLCILDDRQGVVDMWRENGFLCLQVNAWKEPPKHHHLMDADLETLNTEELIFLIKHEREHYKARLDELIKRKNEKKRLLKEISNARIDFAVNNEIAHEVGGGKSALLDQDQPTPKYIDTPNVNLNDLEESEK